MGNQWDNYRLTFETSELKGVLVADSDEYPNNRHRITELFHKKRRAGYTRGRYDGGGRFVHVVSRLR
jgi:hypothetical protein